MDFIGPQGIFRGEGGGRARVVARPVFRHPLMLSLFRCFNPDVLAILSIGFQISKTYANTYARARSQRTTIVQFSLELIFPILFPTYVCKEQNKVKSQASSCAQNFRKLEIYKNLDHITKTLIKSQTYSNEREREGLSVSIWKQLSKPVVTL